MSTRQFAAVSHCRADAATVLALLDDVDGWPTWARPIALHSRWERWGDPAPAGPGAVRKLGAWPVWIRELVLSRNAHGQTYTIVSPDVFAHYLGTVTVEAADAGGVDVEWRVEFVARRTMIAPLLHAVLKATIAGLLTRLTRAAERRMDAPAAR